MMNGYSIKIINTLSQIIFESEINQQLFEIDINTFGSEGLYFIQIINPDTEIIDIRKLILE